MTSPVFDPATLSQAMRKTGLNPIPPEDLPGFGPRGMWRAGSQQLLKAIRGWWLAEPEATQEMLETATAWLSAPPEQGRPWGDAWEIHDAEHALARALAAEMTGAGNTDLWLSAHIAHEAALAVAGAHGRSILAAGAAVAALLAGKEPRLAAGDTEEMPQNGAAILACLAERNEPVSLSRRLYELRFELFSRVPGLELTAFFLWLWRDARGITLKDALLGAYVLAPELSLPLALRERGWEEAPQSLLRSSPENFAQIADTLPRLGLERDRDATAQAHVPDFASWTRQPDLSLELDWSMDGNALAGLEARGKGAGRLAAWLGGTFGLRAAATPEDALTDLLTVPRGRFPAHAASAELRWKALCEIATDAWAPEAEALAHALVRAGLRDSDWRVRMTAVWIVGHRRIADLAAETEAAKAPEIGTSGLRQEDRRVFLALRALAAARSAGQPLAAKPGADPAFLEALSGLLDQAPNASGHGPEGLLTVLLRRRPEDDAQPPKLWRTWAD